MSLIQSTSHVLLAKYVYECYEYLVINFQYLLQMLWNITKNYNSSVKLAFIA